MKSDDEKLVSDEESVLQVTREPMYRDAGNQAQVEIYHARSKSNLDNYGNSKVNKASEEYAGKKSGAIDGVYPEK